MTRLEWIIAIACVAMLLFVTVQIRRIDPLSAGVFIFQEHGWDDFRVCRRIGETMTCKTVGDIFR